jgi:Tol biopolymer transport system component
MTHRTHRFVLAVGILALTALACSLPAGSAVRTQAAKEIFATQTAQAPTRTPKPSLTPTFEPTATPAYGPGRIVFFSNGDLWLINPDGSSLTQLTNSDAYESGPRWSPDGQFILYVDISYQCTNIFRLSSDAATLRQLTDTCKDDSPTWSPDGSQIAFVTTREEYFDLYLMDADGSNQRKVYDSTYGVISPVWGPDGRSIYFYEGDGVYIYDVDTSEVRLFFKDTGIASGFDWSTDEKFMVFHAHAEDAIDIFKVDASGKERTRLTNAPGFDQSPAWSPDSRKIAFVSDRNGGELRLFVQDLTTGEASMLVDIYAADPDWSGPGEGY